MGLTDPIHLVLIAVIALIVIGPKRLPALAQALGRAVHEFREALDEGLAGADPYEHSPPRPYEHEPPGHREHAPPGPHEHAPPAREDV
jgi:TatA/E family protein of Tat protein translocase